MTRPIIRFNHKNVFDIELDDLEHSCEVSTFEILDGPEPRIGLLFYWEIDPDELNRNVSELYLDPQTFKVYINFEGTDSEVGVYVPGCPVGLLLRHPATGSYFVVTKATQRGAVELMDLDRKGRYYASPEILGAVFQGPESALIKLTDWAAVPN